MPGALVHEWLAPTGGSENVFETLIGMFPDASRFCLWNESRGRFTGVEETALARSPLRGNKMLALPLMPLAWRHLPASDADWVLCSSHLFAHHARFGGTARDAPKLVYAHTPARYVWVPELDGRGGSVPARVASTVLKPLDRRRAQEPTLIAANSRFVADRIAATWERESTVIYPPADTEYFSQADAIALDDDDRQVLDRLPDEFVLGASRLVAYKRLDRVLEAGRAAGLPVVISGDGPDRARLEALAAASSLPVTFLGRTSRALLAHLYARARVVVFPPVEDFGIIPVEAMAAGTPVIASAVGGASESVLDGVTGATLDEWSPEELVRALEKALDARPEDCTARASEFGVEAFESGIRAWASPLTGEAR